jgi:hypothetical protein
MPYDPLQKAFVSFFCLDACMRQCFDVANCQGSNAAFAATCTNRCRIGC